MTFVVTFLGTNDILIIEADSIEELKRDKITLTKTIKNLNGEPPILFAMKDASKWVPTLSNSDSGNDADT
jgi:hypothetical protein